MIDALFALGGMGGLLLAYYHVREASRAVTDAKAARIALGMAQAKEDIATARWERAEAVISQLHSEVRRLEDDLSLCVDPAVVRHRFDSLFAAAKANGNPAGTKTGTVSKN